jgi:S-formylglutathione hydrolase FrmB
VKSHAYSIVGVVKLTGTGKNTRLVQVRNPWGKGEWNGAWSDNDSRWTPELKE